MPIQQSTLPPRMVEAPGEVFYPDSDGKPMAETGVHVLVIMDLYNAIELLLGSRADFYLAANMFWYYQEGNPKACKAPDLMVILGVPREPPRRSFKSWIEGAVPDVIFEITSSETWDDDWIQKRALYAHLGVREYFLFDPLEDYLEKQLMAFRLDGQVYIPLSPAADGSLISGVLGARLCSDGLYVRLTEQTTGRVLPHRHETVSAAAEAMHRAEAEYQRAESEREHAELERQRAESERQRAELERQRAESERQRAEAAEAELARLRSLLSKPGPSNEGTHEQP